MPVIVIYVYFWVYSILTFPFMYTHFINNHYTRRQSLKYAFYASLTILVVLSITGMVFVASKG